MEPLCPVDKSSDSIQKVSSLVASGTATGNTTTNLVSLLAAPAAPRLRGGLDFWGWLLLIGCGLLIAGGVLMFFTFLGIGLVGILGIFIAIYFIIVQKQPTEFLLGQGEGMAFIVLILIIALLLSTGFIAGGIFGIRAIQKYHKKSKEEGNLVYEKALPLWESAKAKWERLYFCHRHGIVFDPETGETCEPGGLMNFLYKQAS